MQAKVGGAPGAMRIGPAAIVLICFFVAAIEGYDIQSFGVSAPRIGPEFHLHPAQVGNVGSIAMLGLVVGAFVGGWVADRTGRKPVLVASVVAFGLFSVVTAMTHSYETLLAARFLTGLGFGGAIPNLIAVATEISPVGRRSSTVATMFCGMPAGGAAVALAARHFGSDLPWRDLFLVGGILPLILAPILFFLLPETRKAHLQGSDRSLVRALFGDGRAVPTLLLWVTFVLALVLLYLMLNWLPLLVIAKGLPAAVGSEASLYFNLAGIPGALLLGFVVDRVGYRWSLTAVFLGVAASISALGLAGGEIGVLGLSAITGFLILGANYSLYALSPSLYPPQVRAAGAGAAVGVGRLGSIIGPWLGGQLREAGYSAGQVLGFMAPVVLVAAASILALSFLSKAHADQG
jgi:AAHS family 3-hydroxyphenylpropionic acid transporter